MSRAEQRVFKSADVWRIYCNHLSDDEQVKFRREFLAEDGECWDDDDPCKDIDKELQLSKDTFVSHSENVAAFSGSASEFAESSSDLLDSVGEFFGAMLDDIESLRESNKEKSVQYWDVLFSDSVPDPVERAELVGETVDAIDNMIGGGFAKTGKFAEQLLKKQELWKPRGELVLRLEKQTKKLTALALTAVAFIGGIYKTFVEDCVKPKKK